MAEKKNSKDLAHVVENEIPESPQDEVITIEAEGNSAAKREPVLENGVYTEYDVELLNGVKIPVSVIVDEDNLPSSYDLLFHEGNGSALIMATLTAGTRRLCDLAGSTRADNRDTLAPVIQRARDAADVAKAK